MTKTVSFTVALGDPSSEQAAFDAVAKVPGVAVVSQILPHSSDPDIRRMGIAILTDVSELNNVAAIIEDLEGIEAAGPSAERGLL